MAWTSLVFSVGQILTAAQMNNLQANFTALAQGLSGAPLIQDAALDAKIIDKDNFIDVVAGENWYAPAWAIDKSGSTSFSIIAEWIIPRNGTYRVLFGTQRTTTLDISRVALGVNSVVVSSEYGTSGGTFLNWTEDIAMNRGDRAQALIRTTAAGDLTGVVQLGVSSDSIKEDLSIVSSVGLFNQYQ